MRAKPRPPQAEPFQQYAKPKSHQAAFRAIIDRIAGERRSPGDHLNALLRWTYGAYKRTREEQLFFGRQPPGVVEDLVYEQSPFLRRIPKAK